MKLWLCEKPDVARSLAPVLKCNNRQDGYLAGEGQCITWCFGHLYEQFNPDDYKPEWKRWELSHLPILPEQWRLKPQKGKSKQIRVIQGLLAKASTVVIATDPGREGEMIAREVLDELGYSGPVQRLWLNAQDNASIRRAISSLRPGTQTEGLYQAALARSRADWIMGMNLTRAYTLIARQAGNDGVWSVGRVQTPTLKLVVDRDLAIENFTPEDYWIVQACGTKDGVEFCFTWQAERCMDEQRAQALARSLSELRIDDVHIEKKKQRPPLGYSLSELQKEANKAHGLSAKETLNLAQTLYEKHKLTTYPRTDCRYLPQSQHGDAQRILLSLRQIFPDLADAVAQARTDRISPIWNDKKLGEHHAIIPTTRNAEVGQLSKKELLIYRMICTRYLVQFLPDFEYEATRVDAQGCGEPFRLQGSRVLQPGWKVVTGLGEDKPIPGFDAGEVVSVCGRCEKKQTKPPARYTEGTLLADMIGIGRFVTDEKLKRILRENTGLGTEATRADIIETLIGREYIQVKKKQLISTPKGRALIEMVDARVSDPAITATWEQYLDDLARGSGSLTEFMQGQTGWISQLIQELPREVRKVATGFACPECGRPLRRMTGKKPWWGCTGFRDGCKYTAPDVRGKPGKPAKRFPCDCGGGGEFVERGVADSRFFGCSKYPDCKQTRPWVKGRPGKPKGQGK